MKRCGWTGGMVAMVVVFLLGSGGCGGGDGNDDDAVPSDGNAYTTVPDGLKQNRPSCNYSDGARYISFSGYCWKVRNTTVPETAGANYYSSDPREVWVDDNGCLHMKISHREGKWLCSEIEAVGNFGYGTYVFYLQGYPTRHDANVVLGFFTWDNNFTQVKHISEIDVEITKWGRAAGNNLHYTVQPAYGPDVPEGQQYAERVESVAMALNEPRSTHAFTWSAGNVNFASYEGYGYPTDTAIGTWTFTSANPPRRMNTTTLSTPVVIPAPSATTRAHISLWLDDVAGDDGLGDPPVNGAEVEVVIEGFEYRPQ